MRRHCGPLGGRLGSAGFCWALLGSAVFCLVLLGSAWLTNTGDEKGNQRCSVCTLSVSVKHVLALKTWQR